MAQSFFIKIGVIAVLIFMLTFPLVFILSTIRERSVRNDEAFKEISATWGAAQHIAGPVLTIPYYDADGTLSYGYFLPDSLDVNAELVPEKRYRGIFEVIVYKSEVTLAGSFSRPDFSQWGIESDQVRWGMASITLSMNGMRGIQKVRTFQWNGKPAGIRPGWENGHGIQGLTGVVGSDTEPETCRMAACFPEISQFNISLSLHGSRQMDFSPIADTTLVTVRSTWEHPSFSGSYLPVSRTVTDAGFSAKWRIASYGRELPNHWRSGDQGSTGYIRLLTSQPFGVELMQPVNFYTKSERSVKYGLLIIGLTFLCFFMFEIMNRLKIHPMQYLLVGFSLSIFFLLLVSIAEHIGFFPAYLVSSALCIALVTWYTTYFLDKKSATWITGGELTASFSLFYIILRHEEYCLVIGSSSLFLILAFVMWMTRNLDWYAVFKKSVGRRFNPFKSGRSDKTSKPEAGQEGAA